MYTVCFYYWITQGKYLASVLQVLCAKYVPFLARNLQDLQGLCKKFYVPCTILSKLQESYMENVPFLAVYQESCKILPLNKFN